MLFTMRLSLTILVVGLLSLMLLSTTTTGCSQLSALTLHLTRTPDHVLVVNVSLGTPPVEVVLLMDTGSNLLWTQCQPCSSCFEQQTPIYDSRASYTYEELPCSDPICSSDHKHYNCTNDNHCAYTRHYGDGDDNTGIAATETFSFPDGSWASGVMFGCSKTARTVSGDGFVSGIMGVGLAPESIIIQLFPPEKRRFSYCFSPFTNGDMGATTPMTLGDDVVYTPTLQTPLVKADGLTHHQLYLLDMSVGNCRLGLPAGTFSTTGDGSVVIDSGSTYSMFHEKPYAELLGAFEQQYNAMGLQKTTPQGNRFKLCYWKPAGFNDFLSVTYHFQGADYFVHGNYTSFIDQDRAAYFCVAIKKYKNVVLGAWHQQNMRLVHDVSKGFLAFGPEDCAPLSP